MTVSATRLKGLLGQARAMIAEHDATTPHTAGRVRQTIGGLLIADGLVGLENPLNGRKSRAGILGAALLLVFGVACVGLSIWLMQRGPETDATTTGQVTAVEDVPSRDTCPIDATFTVDGQDYEVQSSSESSGNCDRAIGSPIEVSYDSTDPRVNEIAGASRLLYFVLAFGVLYLVLGLVLFVIRAITIVVGARLYFAGRKQAAANPRTPEDSGAVDAVRKQFVGLIFARTAQPGSRFLAGLGVGPDPADEPGLEPARDRRT